MTPDEIAQLMTPDNDPRFHINQTLVEAGYTPIGKRLAHVTDAGAEMLGLQPGQQVRINLLRLPTGAPHAVAVFHYKTRDKIAGSASAAFDSTESAALLVTAIDNSQ